MSINVAAPYPQYSGSYVPNSVWSGKLLVKFYEACVLAAISNTDYEGEIKKMGDKVIIRTTPTIEIRDYTKGMNLAVQNPESDNVELEINKAKYWNFTVDDIDQFQSDLAFVEDWTRDASEQMKIAIDTDVLGAVYADAHAANKGATAGLDSQDIDLGSAGAPKAVSKTNVLDFIVDMGTVLDEQSVPETDRSLVIPPWMAGMIKKSDLKDASLSGDGTSIMRNGRLGMIDRFTLYSSNLLATGTDTAKVWNIIACQRHGISFAAQIAKTRVINEPESTFGSLVSGLNVYGYEGLKPEAIVHGYIKKG